jgi:lysine-N-methylase
MAATVTEYIAPRYAERFQCIGPDCEDTCCAGWDVPIDASHYKKLKQKMDASKEEREDFRRGIKRYRGADKSDSKFALIVLDDHATCGFLGQDRLCSLQKRYGSELLSDTCAVYPRQVALAGQRVELTAKVSCPEVARQLLLAADSLELVDISPTRLERRTVHCASDPRGGDPYDAALDAVRSGVLRLLADATYPLTSRLAFVGCLADQITPFYYRGVVELDEARLARAVAELDHPEVRRQIHQHFESIVVPQGLAASLVLRVLGSRMQPGTRSLGGLIADILARPDAPDASGSDALDPQAAERALATYEQSKLRWLVAHGSRIDRYFGNYAMNYFLQEWYTSSQSLAVHTRNLFLRLAALRFLLLAHPRVTSCPPGASYDDMEAILDRAAVEVFYKFGRGVEHNADFLRRMDADLAEKAGSLAHALFLVKF